MGISPEMSSSKTPRIERVGNAVFSGALAMGATALFGAKLTHTGANLTYTSVIAIVVFYAASWGLLYLLWDWIFVTRPKQVKKNVPITSKEWQRRQKQFYDNLPRQ
jgi:CHASE2 domain-containing sensor protein